MKASIQKRLFRILGVFVVANTLLWVSLAMLLAYVVEDEVIDRILASEILLLQQSYLQTGSLTQPALAELSLYTNLESVPEPLQGQLSASPTGGEVFASGNSHYHFRWLQFSGMSPVLLVAEVSSWLVVSRLSPDLFILLFVGFSVATLFGLVAVYQIAKITTRPLRQLTTAIEQEPRQSPLPHTQQQDEVGVLASAMDGALTGLQQALDRETVFTRDVSHELRTPLTTLRNALTLLPEEKSADPQLEQVSQSCREMEGLLEVLLTLARAESSVMAPLKLRSMLESLLLERMDKHSFDLSLEVPDAMVLEGNEAVSRLLLGNLLDNALHYAKPRRLAIRLEQDALVLENPYDPHIHAPHSGSLGHGLSLVGRLAKAQGWHFSYQKTDSQFQARLCW